MIKNDGTIAITPYNVIVTRRDQYVNVYSSIRIASFEEIIEYLRNHPGCISTKAEGRWANL